jgi:hypothetical protein
MSFGENPFPEDGRIKDASTLSAQRLHSYTIKATEVARVQTSTAGGLRSRRERKDHTPSAGPDEPPGKGKTLFGMRKGPSSGVCKELTFGACPPGSHPTVFANARYVALAPTAVRNRRRVSFVPIEKLSPIKRDFSTIWCSA